MRSVRTRRFKTLYGRLEPSVRFGADKAFGLWIANSAHPGLNFEKVDDEASIWSVRIGLNHRALCVKRDVDGETRYVWFWIGNHAEYDRLLDG